MMNDNAMTIKPIGTIRRTGESIRLEIAEPFRPALKALDQFSHVIVLWWAHQLDTAEMRAIMQTEPPYAPGHVTGLFATRAPYRPNPISLTTCKLLGMDEAGGVLQVADIDALDGTPIIDLKAYFPVCDRVQSAIIPEWLEGWPEWMPEEGLGLEKYEQ
jgi:tRNA-Thr(GGU) m(6)t(6)A37 methyltransferase TsaA